MNDNRGFYQDYDVMSLMDEWDSTTKEIVSKRLEPYSNFRFLSEHHQELLYSIAAHLVYENREPVLQWIVAHFDQKLSDVVGEGQRKPGIPPQDILIKDGLDAIDHVAENRHGHSFLGLTVEQQFEILSALQHGNVPSFPAHIPPKDLFTKLLTITVDAYYSHPTVWSEIGYGGPAYPRGYVRIELGITDPWEPKLKEGD